MNKKIFLISLLISLIFLSACQNNNYDENNVFCESFTDRECFGYNETCELCTESVISSNMSCHSKEFCTTYSLSFLPEETI